MYLTAMVEATPLVAAIPEVRPLSKTDPEAVTEMTHWLDSHTKPAGNGHAAA
ncbi:MAG: hypothetical protein IPM18_00860 [Phycisphaerales bacterium]|nr:hypothetical protein [Phycisphaerales bacterium]